jgi:hypothetical protein
MYADGGGQCLAASGFTDEVVFLEWAASTHQE